MPTATSNVDDVLRDLKAIALSFGFEATIEGKTLGDDIAGITADMIAARSIDTESGADGQWPANAPKYAEWKAAKYGVDKPNFRTGQMLSIESLIGGTAVSTHDVQMQYGTGQPPTRSATGQGFNSATDGSVTDIEKAYFCSTTRPFYMLDETIGDAVFARVEQCLDEYLLKGW
jgi:hypothetical protein